MNQAKARNPQPGGWDGTTAAVIMAAGLGKRMKSALPKDCTPCWVIRSLLVGAARPSGSAPAAARTPP